MTVHETLATGVKTKGLGSTGNVEHLNLTRSLADVAWLHKNPSGERHHNGNPVRAQRSGKPYAGIDLRERAE